MALLGSGKMCVIWMFVICVSGFDSVRPFDFLYLMYELIQKKYFFPFRNPEFGVDVVKKLGNQKLLSSFSIKTDLYFGIYGVVFC